MFNSHIARTVLSATGALVIGGAFLTAATAPAVAATVSVSKTVSHADLDLTKPQGRATLDARIKAAARAVCNVSASGDLHTRRDETRCTRTAIAAASRS